MSAGTQAAQAQQKFSNLRRRLDQLGYRQPLGIESLPLVERLFADLIHTTESLKNAKLEIGRRTSDEGDFESAVEPYKSDNANLVKENNEIHLQVIKQKEDLDAVIRELKASLHKLEHENADLKFLNNQYVHKVRHLERESKDKTDHILKLQEKNFHAVVQTPGGKKKSIPFRRQRMEIDSVVPESDQPKQHPSLADDPYVADLLQVADSRVGEMELELQMMKDEREVEDRKLKNFKEQVELRDAEIERLNRMLDGGRPSDVVALEARNRANERMISHLNIQIDFLQQKNREMDRKLTDAQMDKADADDRISKLASDNMDIQMKMQNADRLVKRHESDKNIVIRTADSELTGAKVELEKSRQDLESMDLHVAQSKVERKYLQTEINECKSNLSLKTDEMRRLEELLDKVTEDKKRLSQRNNKLTANEKELILEIERLKTKNGPVKKKSKVPSKLDSLIKSLEDERDYYKNQNDTLTRMIRTGATYSPATSPLPKNAGSRNQSPVRTRSPVRAKVGSRMGSPVRGASPSKLDKQSIDQYESMLRILKDEKAFYKKEYEVLKATRKSAMPTRTSPTKSFGDEGEVARLTKERDEMQALLDKFERHMAEIQANVKILASERDQLNKLYEDTKLELQNTRREIMKSPKSAKTSLAAQAVLRRVENERDDAVCDLRRITTERDSLRERLKIATETSLSDRARLEQRLEDLTTQKHMVESECDEQISRTSVQRETISSLEKQIKDQAIRLSETTDHASQHKTSATHMRLLAEEAERNLDASQKCLSQREDILLAHEQRCMRLEERVGELQRANKIAQEELSQLRTTVNMIDREKDVLQIAVDEKAERIAVMQDDNMNKDRIIADFKVRGSELEAHLDHGNDNLSLKDREVKSLRRQLDGTTEDMTEASRAKDVAMRENRRLQDDLSVMTRENQSLNQELQDALNEKDVLKTQVQDYIEKYQETEDLLASKEEERSDLLEQYRQLSMETEQYQSSYRQLESQGSSLKLELITKDSEIRRLQDRVDSQNKEIQQFVQSQQSGDVQISNLSRSLSNMENTAQQLEEEKESILQDLGAVRDLCTRLEAAKDSLQRQVTACSLDKESLQGQIDELSNETEVLRSQHSSERVSVKNLETLLADNREKEFQTQLSAQERNAEIQLLKDRLSLNDSKLQSQNREITSLRTRNVDMEGEVERLRRSLTNERFEKERAIQEMKRHGLTPPIADTTTSSAASAHTSRSPNRYRSSTASPLSTSGRYQSPERNALSFDDDLLRRPTSRNRDYR